MNIQKIISILALLAMGVSFAFAEPPTKFTNQGSIANTRHNLTQSTMAAGSFPGFMNVARNNYGEVCVYCHTPHGANTTVSAPLWNRTMKATTYTTYTSTTLTQTVSQPGAASLVCLSCHDGQTAVDSIINMPGTGRYEPSQATTQNNGFLDTWPGGPATLGGGHGSLNTDPAVLWNAGECMRCHSVNGPFYFEDIPAFDVFNLTTDLSNDHPVGVTFPSTTGPGTDFNTPGGVQGTTKYFDTNGNSKFDGADIRMYNDGGSVKVECASCHDPHGVPSAGPGSTFIPTFLRVSNSGSLLCLTCHSK